MKVTLYAYWTQHHYETEPNLLVFSFEMPTKEIGGPARKFAGKFEFDLDIQPATHDEMVSGLVANIEAKQTALRHEINKLDVKVADLLCIENKEPA